MHHNHQPTNQQKRAPNEPARPICAQESVFWGKNGRFGAKHPNYFVREQKLWYTHIRKPLSHYVRIISWSAMGPNRPNLDHFGPKILILTGGGTSFGSHVTEKPPKHLARIVIWSGMGPNGPKMTIFDPK